ncbi:MAG: cytochrome c biogenesis protein CcdA [Bacteroidales bacterium]|nr:cytochrome c biogenesis protein CcdA [Bacteroidales bacterium]MDD4671808.1 cytochrome c biogenesis protein CcdA [Bacteroidales bacterium]MDY0347332.1 cytochrome c biogenesis protein CcdA [Tenuifilaceae bacterium]
MKKNILIVFFVALASIAGAQVNDPVSWTISSKQIDSHKYQIVLEASIDMGWHLYSSELPDGGPLPTSIVFEENDSYKIIGKLVPEGKPNVEFDEVFDMELAYFDAYAKFTQIIELNDGAEGANISGEIEYQACYEDKCIFLTKDFSTKVGNAITQTEASSQIDTIEESALPTEASNTDSSLLVFFLISFAAGLAGLLTPCVFPMIPMTVSFFMNKQKNRFNAILNAFIFGISIIVIYTSIGLLVSLTGMGAGFANQLVSHWLPNLIFFVLFMAFAASFFGLFEIMLPSSLSTKTDSKAEKGGFVGSFFMALTLVIVSLSCVGPIVGAILVESAAGLGLKPLIGMFGFSLAFAVPFTLFAIFPSWLNKLPKSGGWLNSVKIVLGFIVLAFGLKFLATVDQAYHWNILGREVYLALWIAIFSMLGLYLLGKIRFKLDSKVEHIGFFRMLLAIASFAFVIYLIPGMFGAPLKGLSGLVPPKTGHSFDLEQMITQNQGVVSIQEKSSICQEPKYADILQLPHGLQGYFDYDQALACAKQQDKPLFVDFVGHACSNCKVMEQRVWSDPKVLEILQRDYVIVALYVDERTKLPESDWVISSIDGKVKKTMGKKNADFQISRFNVNSQPFYVLLSPNEELLAKPHGYNTNVDDFVAFLNEGVTQHNKKKQNSRLSPQVTLQ